MDTSELPAAYAQVRDVPGEPLTMESRDARLARFGLVGSQR